MQKPNTVSYSFFLRTAGNEGIAGEKRINRNNIEKLIEKNFKVNKIDEVSHKYKIV